MREKIPRHRGTARRILGEIKMRIFISVFMIALPTCYAPAQTPSGVINGRVMRDDGQPIPYATVVLSGIKGGAKPSATRSLEINTDEEGNFQAEGLDPILYEITAWAWGYVLAPNSNAAAPGEIRYARIGQSVTFIMIRGGVITGRVIDADGEPVIGITVRAQRVRDEAGLEVKTPNLSGETDDRGIYRIYGLRPGSYLVSAGKGGRISTRPKPFDGKTTTYFPSSTRDTADLVRVTSGAEATGVDIRYRGEAGFAISGKVFGAPKADLGKIVFRSPSVLLRMAATGETIARTSVSRTGEQNGYAIYGIPNGEYQVVAQYDGREGENGSVSGPRNVTVKGSDMIGIDLALTSNAMIAGTVTIDKSPPSAKCNNLRESHLEEVIVSVRRDEQQEKPEFLLPIFDNEPVGVPDEKGVFSISNLNAGRYRLDTEFPDENWYLKSIEMTGRPSVPAINYPHNRIALKSGERITGLNITLTTNGAGLRGKVIGDENAKLPARLRVYLLPAETESKDNLLRFYEVWAEKDGEFRFSNLAPGKYLILAREPENKTSQLAAWDVAERAKLRKEAEADHTVIELKMCQRMTDYVLKLAR